MNRPCLPDIFEFLRLRLGRSLAVVLLLLGLSGCVVHHHKQVGASRLDDQVTTDRVHAALNPQRNPEFRNVQVSTSAGVVTLRGFVKSETAREHASQVAQTVHRVEKLQNELQVRP